MKLQGFRPACWDSKIKSVIENALKDKNEYVRDNAIDAKDDTELFLKWKY